jgi:hypothetical protein
MKPRLVIIEFKDHCQGDADARLITCEAIGMLYKEDEEAYYVACWIAEGTLDHNTEQFVISKADVSKIVELKPQLKSQRALRLSEPRKRFQKRTQKVDLSEPNKLKILA